jgi:hypothetical protein
VRSAGGLRGWRLVGGGCCSSCLGPFAPVVAAQSCHTVRRTAQCVMSTCRRVLIAQAGADRTVGCMVSHQHAPGSFRLHFAVEECSHDDDPCACDVAYDDAHEGLLDTLERTTQELGVIAWLEIDGSEMYVLRNEFERAEFVADAVGASFDASFDGRWLVVRSSGRVGVEVTCTLLAVRPWADDGAAVGPVGDLR